MNREPSYSVGTARDTFVPAPREPVQVRRMEVLPPDAHELQAPGVVRTLTTVNTSHWDRARGFSLVTLPLSAAVGVGALLISLYLFAVPLWSLGALVVLFLGFMAAWLVAWIIYQLVSPDGAAIVGTIGHYKLLRYEQRARLRRMERDQ